MYAVIFRATLNKDDQGYSEISNRMRELAFDKYHCIDLSVCVEGHQEIAISYWRSLEDIKAWREDAEHIAAQTLGREKWLSNYKVEICEVHKAYAST